LGEYRGVKSRFGYRRPQVGYYKKPFRSTEMIVRDLLDFLRKKKGNATITDIMYKVNLNHGMAKSYVKLLVDREDVEGCECLEHRRNNKGCYRITEGGMATLQEIRSIDPHSP